MAVSQQAAPGLCCIRLQESLDMLAGTNYPHDFTANTGFLDSIMSPYNTQGFGQLNFSNLPGKGRPTTDNLPNADIWYDIPDCSASGETAVDLCDPCTDTPGRQWLQVSIDDVRSRSGGFDKADFDALCESPQERLARDIRNAANRLKESIDIALLEIAYALLGDYADGSPSTGQTTVPGDNVRGFPVISTEGYVIPGAFVAMQSQFRRMYSDRAPILVGGTNIAAYTDLRATGGTGFNAVNAPSQAVELGMPLWYDQFIDQEYNTLEGTSNIPLAIAYAPGSFQLLEWYRNSGYWQELGKEDYVETTLTIDGITYDYLLQYDKCNHRWCWALQKWFGLFYVPDVAFSPCFGFNRRIMWSPTCGDFDCTVLE